MPRTLIARSLPLLLLLMLGLSRPASAQNIPFTSGPIPMCDTSTFTANVSGYGYLSSWGEPWSSWIESKKLLAPPNSEANCAPLSLGEAPASRDAWPDSPAPVDWPDAGARIS